MSRTDKTNPEWVKALHAAEAGRATRVRHSMHCAEYVNTYTGAGPSEFVTKRVDRDVATANDWEISPYWDYETGPTVMARVPQAPFECQADSATGKCSRYIVGFDRRVLCSCCAPPRNPHRRAAERDYLRNVVKEFNASPGFEDDPDWEPGTRSPEDVKIPWQGRYVRG